MSCPVPDPPTLAGFQAFIYGTMGVPTSALPSFSPAITTAFTVAMATVNETLAIVPPIYALAVYNLGGSLLINFAPDTPPSTYFFDLRTKAPPLGYNIYAFQPGVVSEAHDETTGNSLLNPDFMKGFTMSDLQRLKDPFGRQYLSLSQDYGTAPFGLS